MAVIVGLSGRKQSGKSSTAAFLERWYEAEVLHFADPLKRFCIDVLGLEEEQCYGTEDDKNSLTDLRFEDMPGDALDDWEPGPMSARHVLQFFGTDIVRQMKPSAWVDATMRRAAGSLAPLVVIADVRFPDEADAILAAGGEVIRLARQIDTEDQHYSETALNQYSRFSHFVPAYATLTETFYVASKVARKLTAREE
jgi:hypothetical protein